MFFFKCGKSEQNESRGGRKRDGCNFGLFPFVCSFTCGDNKLTGPGGAGVGKDTGVVAGADSRMGGGPIGGAG